MLQLLFNIFFFSGGGWTLVASISSRSLDHFKTKSFNCLNHILCVRSGKVTVPTRKLDDKDIHKLAAYEGKNENMNSD